MVLNQKGAPVAVLTGSTNWTSTGLCTQTTWRSPKTAMSSRPSPLKSPETGIAPAADAVAGNDEPGK